MLKYKNILILYGSTTGNTRDLVYYLAKQLSSECTTEIVEVCDLPDKYQFKGQYDLIILSSATWGVDPATLQEDFTIFWDNLDKSTIANKDYAIIGIGDSYYPYFGFAVEILKNSLQDFKGNIIADLKIQDPWEETIEIITQWLINILKK